MDMIIKTPKEWRLLYLAMRSERDKWIRRADGYEKVCRENLRLRALVRKLKGPEDVKP